MNEDEAYVNQARGAPSFPPAEWRAGRSAAQPGNEAIKRAYEAHCKAAGAAMAGGLNENPNTPMADPGHALTPTGVIPWPPPDGSHPWSDDPAATLPIGPLHPLTGAPTGPLKAPDPDAKAPAPKRYRSVFTGQMEERYDPTPRDYQPSGVTPVYTRRLSERMATRAAHIKHGREMGYDDARLGIEPNMGILGCEHEWLAHGYRIGYALGERETK